MSVLSKPIEAYNKLPKQVKAAGWYVICSFLQKGISFITTPIFTRLLSPTEYGMFSVFTSWMDIIAIFVTLRLCYGVYSQGLIKFDTERQVFSSSLQGLTLTLALTWTAIYLIFHNFWNGLFGLTTVQMLAMLAMIWTSAVFGFWSVEQRVKLNYIKLVIITIVVSVAKPVVGIILVINAQDKVTARILGLAIVELISYSGFFVLQMKRGKTFFSKKFWKYVLSFNIPLIPHYLSQTVLNSSDRIMISNLVNESAAGIYSLAYSVSMIMRLFNNAFSDSIYPWFCQKIKDNKLKETEPVAYISMILIAVINLLLIAFAPEVIALFAPKSYQDAIWVIPPIAMSVFFIFIYDLFSTVEFYYEKTKFVMIASLIAALLNIVLNYIFINLFGYFAAGYTTMFCYVVYATAHFCFMKKICKEKVGDSTVFSPKVIVTISMVFVLLGVVFMCLYNYPLYRYIASGMLSFAVVINYRKIIGFVKLIYSKRHANETCK